MNQMRTTFRRFLRRQGFDVIRYTPGASGTSRLALALRHHDISLVFDVGANTGQYAHDLLDAGYEGRIVSFEPLAAAHAALSQAALRTANWVVAPRAAVGSGAGILHMHVAANSVSSSALPMLQAHLDAAPASRNVGTEEVPMYTLDAIAQAYIEPNDRIFLKIDTQGYEGHVLDGAGLLLPRIAGLQLEMSLVPLYDGQVLFEDLLARAQRAGFELYSLTPGFSDARTGRMLQVDGIFFRPQEGAHPAPRPHSAL